MVESASQAGLFHYLVQHLRGHDVEVEANLCTVPEGKGRWVGTKGDVPELTKRKRSKDRLVQQRSGLLSGE